MDFADLTKQLKQAALAAGFDAVGIAPAVTPSGLHRFEEWLSCGYAGEMSYLGERFDAYAHPGSVLEGAKSLMMLALDYRTVEPTGLEAGQGRVSRYAWGEADYHDLIRVKLNGLRESVERLMPGATTRGVVDTAPLLEREFAQLAGLGWQGKHTLLIRPQGGSYFFLAALLFDVELVYDAAFSADHCGDCTACLDACPTDAFPQPYVLDATRCISYLTIELKSQIPEEFRSGLGEWLFGCDICQEVCPWNRFAPRTGDPGLLPRGGKSTAELVSLFSLTDEAFRGLFRRTPLWRPKRRGLLRNAAIVLANNPCEHTPNALQRGARDEEPLVREACEWALRRLSR